MVIAVESVAEDCPWTDSVKFLDWVCDHGSPGIALELERKANRLNNLAAGEKFAIRFVDRNFDGTEVGKWCVFFHSPRLSVGGQKWTLLTQAPGDPGDLLLGALVLYLEFVRGGKGAVAKFLGEQKILDEKNKRLRVSDDLSRSIEIFLQIMNGRKTFQVPATPVSAGA